MIKLQIKSPLLIRKKARKMRIIRATKWVSKKRMSSIISKLFLISQLVQGELTLPRMWESPKRLIKDHKCQKKIDRKRWLPRSLVIHLSILKEGVHQLIELEALPPQMIMFLIWQDPSPSQLKGD